MSNHASYIKYEYRVTGDDPSTATEFVQPVKVTKSFLNGKWMVTRMTELKWSDIRFEGVNTIRGMNSADLDGWGSLLSAGGLVDMATKAGQSTRDLLRLLGHTYWPGDSDIALGARCLLLDHRAIVSHTEDYAAYLRGDYLPVQLANPAWEQESDQELPS